ncbi:MAG: aminopeptidase P family protein [Chloroflexi bacterium]|nr:aminopeptidase P family protein [Chloroflexota bacterium]
MNDQRLARTRRQLAAKGIDALALVPGPNMIYLAGLSLHLSERPSVLIVRTDGGMGIIAPSLEAPRVAQTLGPAVQVFAWADEEGHEGAFAKACAAMGLANSTLAIEYLQMRAIEVKAFESHAPGVKLVALEQKFPAFRAIKDADEIAATKRAVAIMETALHKAMQAIKPGVTEREIAAVYRAAAAEAGSEGMPFSPIVASGPNAANPHSVVSDRQIQPGDLVIIDCGTLYGGYVADITRTFAVGAISAEAERIYNTVLEANRAGVRRAAPDVACGDVDRAARDVIAKAGYGPYFIHRTGHGLGMETHEPPYMVGGNPMPLEAGMIFTVEPGIYIEGQVGVRIEDDVVCTENGVEVLTTFERGLIRL